MPFDTSSSAEAIQAQVQQQLSREARLLLAFEMSDFARELARAGVRRAHPEWTNEQITRELLRLSFLPEPLPTSLQ